MKKHVGFCILAFGLMLLLVACGNSGEIRFSGSSGNDEVSPDGDDPTDGDDDVVSDGDDPTDDDDDDIVPDGDDPTDDDDDDVVPDGDDPTDDDDDSYCHLACPDHAQADSRCQRCLCDPGYFALNGICVEEEPPEGWNLCNLCCPLHAKPDAFCSYCLCDEGYQLENDACILLESDDRGICTSFDESEWSYQAPLCLRPCEYAQNTCPTINGTKMSCRPYPTENGELFGWCMNESTNTMEELERWVENRPDCVNGNCQSGQICLPFQTGDKCLERCPMIEGGCPPQEIQGMDYPIGCSGDWFTDPGTSVQVGVCMPYDLSGDYESLWPSCEEPNVPCTIWDGSQP